MISRKNIITDRNTTNAASNLQALLNSEVEPTNVNNVGSGSSSLERLVSGQAISSPASPLAASSPGSQMGSPTEVSPLIQVIKFMKFFVISRVFFALLIYYYIATTYL